MHPSALNFGNLLRRGDSIVWGQGPGEPLPLTQALIAQRASWSPLSVFVGMGFSDTLRPGDLDGIKVSSYGALGSTRSVASGPHFDLLPLNISQLGRAIEDGLIGCDVALVQLSPPGPNGKPSLGPINDYIRAAMRRARVVIAEVNDQLPWTYGQEVPALDRIALRVPTSRPLIAPPSRPPSVIDRAIAKHASSVIPDGATLQLGVGGTVDALLACLRDRRDLGIHSGAIGDSVLDLIEQGVVTNALKPLDTGVTVSAALLGGRRLLDAAHRNPAFAVQPYEYTHSAAVLSQIQNLVAINSALQVDVTGAVNSEIAGGRYIGAIGGQVDFMHAAARSRQGCSLIALPSTVDGESASRIRVQVETVTCARCEVDYVVTEYGAANLRGRPLRERIRRMIDIAHPKFREELEREASERSARGF